MGTGAAEAENVDAGSTSNSLPDIPDLAQMNSHGQRVALAYWESGYVHGYSAGYDAAVAEQDALDRAAAGLGTMLSHNPSYAELCERRGQQERAESQRQTLAERGIL